MSQIGPFWLPAQSAFDLHPRQSPVPVSQIGISFGQLVGVHAAWHWWSAQQEGAAAPQSEFEAHWSHRPAMHRGSLAGQSELLRHSTQPSVESQNGWPPPH